MAIQLDIYLKRNNKVYREGESVDGLIRLESSTDFKHDGITLTMEGTVSLSLSSKNSGVFDAFYNSTKPVQILFAAVEIEKGGKMPSGVTEIPFEIPLVPRANKTLYETYHGVFINIQYKLNCDLKRHFLSKHISKEVEFFVEYHRGAVKDQALLKRMVDSSVKFTITPTSCRGINRSETPIPSFSFSGIVDATICDIASPFAGEITIQKGNGVIKSIELQLVRVETCGCAEGFAREGTDTEIQNIQIAEGDVPNNIQVPIYMVFPRLYSCPTLLTANFKIEFEVNIIIIFQDKHLVTENLPIILIRK